MFVQIHPVKLLRVLQRQHVRPVLVELEKICPVFVENRKMRGDDGFLRADSSAIRDADLPFKCQSARVLTDVHPLCDSGGELAWVKLCLMVKADGTSRFYRQRQPRNKRRLRADAPECSKFTRKLFTGVCAVDISWLFFKIAVDMLCQLAVARERGLVRVIICPRGIRAVLPRQLVVDQPVLRGKLGCGVARHTGADCVCFDEQIVRTGFLQRICAQKPCQSAADDQNVGFCILLQRRECGQRHARPDGVVHTITADSMHS